MYVQFTSSVYEEVSLGRWRSHQVHATKPKSPPSCPRIFQKYLFERQDNTSLKQWILKSLWRNICPYCVSNGPWSIFRYFLIVTVLNVNNIKCYTVIWNKTQIIMCWKKYKTFQKKIIENFSNSKKLFPYVGIKKWLDKEISEYNINPSRATSHT